MDDKALTRRWFIFAVGGLLLCGFGLSLLGEAILQRFKGEAWWYWAAWGTAALCAFNAGLSLFGQAVIYRVQKHRQAGDF